LYNHPEARGRLYTYFCHLLSYFETLCNDRECTFEKGNFYDSLKGEANLQTDVNSDANASAFSLNKFLGSINGGVYYIVSF
jgi:hypothetical protein